MWTVTARDAATGTPVASTQLRQGTLWIGRHPECQLQLPSLTVSRRHARIVLRDDGRTELIDEGSANGCSVDGQRVVDPVVLSADSVVGVGDYVLSLEPLAAPMAPRDSAAAAPVARTVSTGSTLTDLLEHQIGAIQAHRATLANREQQRRESFEAGWTEVLTAAQQMRTRFRGDARVPYFFINRDATEIVARVVPSHGAASVTLSVSRTPAEKATVAGLRAWFRVLGEEPVSYAEPDQAMSEFVKRLASRLA